ncbi:MAG: hypothetical protein ABIQ47_18010 [Tepidiformaceae bacterium]
MEAGDGEHELRWERLVDLPRVSRLSSDSTTRLARARAAGQGQLARLHADDFDGYEANLSSYAEEVGAALCERLTADEVADLARIDNECAVELSRLKGEVAASLAGLARRSQAASAYLAAPTSPRSDARSA